MVEKCNLGLLIDDKLECEKKKKPLHKMAENWNLTSVEPLDDTNYFLWSEKIEGILRAKKLWKRVIDIKPPEEPEEGTPNYDIKFRLWNEWDDNNYAARTVMINTMSKA